MTASAQLQPEQPGGSLRGAFGFPTAISMGSLQPRVSFFWYTFSPPFISGTLFHMGAFSGGTTCT